MQLADPVPEHESHIPLATVGDQHLPVRLIRDEQTLFQGRERKPGQRRADTILEAEMNFPGFGCVVLRTVDGHDDFFTRLADLGIR